MTGLAAFAGMALICFPGQKPVDSIARGFSPGLVQANHKGALAPFFGDSSLLRKFMQAKPGTIH